MNYERLYQYRFRNVDQPRRAAVWNVIAADIYRRMGSPNTVLDPAAGRGEFINAIPAREKWAIDAVDQGVEYSTNVRVIFADIFTEDLPKEHFDGIFVSNFLEHLPTQQVVAELLERLRDSMTTGGTIAIMGPNFRYCSKQYFDCADHTLALTHTSIEEHLFAAGFEIQTTLSRYLPFSFRGKLPPSPAMVSTYLRSSALQRLLGKQFLVLAVK
jgi:2-polyprenyl-3-methyl-5-hydroxy-6-metoxy-1,4-benzoquinol methylase